jgi:hypothetical protein
VGKKERVNGRRRTVNDDIEVGIYVDENRGIKLVRRKEDEKMMTREKEKSRREETRRKVMRCEERKRKLNENGEGESE